ncbi:unnamed protein product [Urochloa humidicola]
MPVMPPSRPSAQPGAAAAWPTDSSSSARPSSGCRLGLAKVGLATANLDPQGEEQLGQPCACGRRRPLPSRREILAAAHWRRSRGGPLSLSGKLAGIPFPFLKSQWPADARGAGAEEQHQSAVGPSSTASPAVAEEQRARPDLGR